MLGVEALQAGNFEIAKKCFTRLKDLPFLDLTTRLEREGKNMEEFLIKSEVLCYLGKFQEAADLLIKHDRQEKAVSLFTELKRWDEAKMFAKKSSEQRRASSAHKHENTMQASNFEMTKFINLTAGNPFLWLNNHASHL